ncbi:MAG: Mur ligase domain-containing protein [bacterium]|nr:Mur ligase domain-containing protein [bacterium]
MKQEKRNRVHFIGIGGIGMSALARYFLSEKWQVSGSDLSPSSITDELRKEGVKFFSGHKAANISTNIQLVVYNNAIPVSNQELSYAKELGLACRTYPEVVGELTRTYKTIAIAGSHGKSTTTAMTALILIEAGIDPTVIVGTKLKEFGPPSAPSGGGGKNFRKGKGGYLVLEADEWKAAFHHYSPFVATITNIDAEHLDFYKTFANVKKSFEKFKSQCHKIVERPTDKKIAEKIRRVLKIPGEHNVQNALNAYAVASFLEIPEKIILSALGKYQGAWRRMEYRGKLGNALVYDDYGHHPSEIKATLAGFRQKWPKNALICVFQPHQAKRLVALYDSFKTAFKDASRVVILPTYQVAGREAEKTNNRRLTTNDKTAEGLAKDIGATYVPHPEIDLKKVLLSLVARSSVVGRQSPPVIVMMGAGTINELTPKLLTTNY